MNQPKAHVSQYKKGEASRLEAILPKYKVIAIADMTSMPSPQLQKLRSNLKGQVLITMSKGRIIKITFNKLKDKIKGLDELSKYVKGMPALLLTNDNPFKLAKGLKKSKSTAPAKAGQIAPNDITVIAGPTSFPPGPIMGELGQVGIKTTVVEGKINIKDDVVVVKEGQAISGMLAGILTRLGIEPMEIGISLLAALEDGIIFGKDVLSIDEEQYIANIKQAYLHAFNLAFNVEYPTNENIKLLIKKAFLDSKAVADSKSIQTSESVKKELAKANLEAESLKSKLNLPEEVSKEEPQKEQASNSRKPSNEVDNMKKDEEVAQAVLKKLQDEKLTKGDPTAKNPVKDAKFEKEEKKAQDVLKKLQDEKMKKS